jgi:hypothetical protein
MDEKLNNAKAGLVLTYTFARGSGHSIARSLSCVISSIEDYSASHGIDFAIKLLTVQFEQLKDHSGSILLAVANSPLLTENDRNALLVQIEEIGIDLSWENHAPIAQPPKPI